MYNVYTIPYIHVHVHVHVCVYAYIKLVMREHFGPSKPTVRQLVQHPNLYYTCIVTYMYVYTCVVTCTDSCVFPRVHVLPHVHGTLDIIVYLLQKLTKHYRVIS
jgi:hypothetical protein